MTTLTAFDAYLAGEATPSETARALMMDLGEVEDEIAPLERQRKSLREHLARVLERCDGRRYAVPGYATAKLAEPALVRQWNTDRLARLCAWLRETERDEIAEMIETCREEAPRAGGLRVEREVR